MALILLLHSLWFTEELKTQARCQACRFSVFPEAGFLAWPRAHGGWPEKVNEYVQLDPLLGFACMPMLKMVAIRHA